MQVRAKETHIQPGTLQYRSQGEEFDHDGPLYDYVEKVKKGSKPEPEKESGEEVVL